MKFIKLFFYRPFLGVNLAQFFDTLCNNFTRNAITAAVIFDIIVVADNTAISSLMVGILMIPSFLFMATAGEMVDKYPKDLIIKTLKICQVFIAFLACIGFATENIGLLLIALFLMGTAAAFLSTAKYSILPDIVPKKNLLITNSLMQMTVLAAILGGTVLGGIIFSFDEFVLYTGLITASLAGLFFAFIIPHQTICSPDTIVHKNLLIAMWKTISLALKNKEILINIMGISWFWFVGTVLISQVPTLVKYVLNGNNVMFTFFIVLLSVGVSMGTICCQILLRGNITDKLSLPCLAVITLTLADLSYASIHYVTPPDIVTLKYFLSKFEGLRMVTDILIFSMAGGIYIVPLTTMLQISAPSNLRARIIAANNIINALFMILGSGFCAILLMFEITIPSIIIILSILNCIIALFLWYRKNLKKDKI